MELEIFPYVKKELLDKRVNYLVDLLELNNVPSKKVVYFQKEEHVYFSKNEITNWNIVRIKCKAGEVDYEIDNFQNYSQQGYAKEIGRLTKL